MNEHIHTYPPSRGGYVRGCRCVACKAANSAYARAYAKRRWEQGRRCPSQAKTYHAAYCRQWRTRRAAHQSYDTTTQVPHHGGSTP